MYKTNVYEYVGEYPFSLRINTPNYSFPVKKQVVENVKIKFYYKVDSYIVISDINIISPKYKIGDSIEIDGINGIVDTIDNDIDSVNRYSFMDFVKDKVCKIVGNVDLPLPNGWFKLGEKFGTIDKGKYQTNLLIINNQPIIDYIREDNEFASRLNLMIKASLSFLYGDFFTTKKGTKAFEVKSKQTAKHVLVRDSWGGSFNSYRGRQLNELNNLYHRRASSNGGGTGYDYAIFDINFENRLSIDDL